MTPRHSSPKEGEPPIPTLRIDVRKYPMVRPFPTHKLGKDVILYALGEAKTLIWYQLRETRDPYLLAQLQADHHFMTQNEHPFMSRGIARMSPHHAMNEADYSLETEIPGKGRFRIPRAPHSNIPIWTGAPIRALEREIKKTGAEHRHRHEKMPEAVSTHLRELRWRRDLFVGHSVPVNNAINSDHPDWAEMRNLAAYDFHKNITFGPGLTPQEAKKKDTEEALSRMNETILILPYSRHS